MLKTIILFLLTIIIFLYYYVKRKYSYWERKNIKFIEPKFPLGTLIPATKEHNIYVMAKQYEKFKSSSSFCGLYFFLTPVILATDLDFIKTVLVKDFNYFVNRGIYFNEKDDPLSAHLLTIEDEKWKNLRAKLTPTFTSGKMKFMFPTIINVANEFIKTLNNEIKINNEIEMKDLLGRFTTDVIGTCAFGIECNSLIDANAKFREMGRKTFGIPKLSRFTSILIGIYPNLSKKLGITTTYPDVSEFFLDAVRDTIKYREDNQIKRNDFMDLLIELKSKELNDNGLSVEQIAAQAFVFFLAGFETSSTTMSFTLYELALNPEIQERGRNEIKNVLKKYNNEMCYEAIMEMKYLEQIINESLRKYPPGHTLIRTASQDYRVPDKTTTIEKGTRLIVPVYGIHHDPDLYENPEDFNPDRFSLENSKKRNPYSFLPFGEGPRNCIGLRFGMMQAKIGLATILNNYEFKMGSKTEIPLKFRPNAIVLTSVGGLWLDIKKIDK